ncbi:N-acetylmuramoyl-L-alanine amidase [Patescibacteria group bacterium]
MELGQNDEGDFLKNKTYVSEPIRLDINFNAFAVRFKANIPEKTDISIESRTRSDEDEWKDWREVWSEKEPVQEGGRDDGVGVSLNEKGAYTYSELMFPDRNSGETSLIQFKIDLATTDLDISPSLDEVIIEAINTLEEKDSEVSEVKAITAPSVISRAGWGANESWMTWTPQYADVENFYVHHTVSMNNDPNPPATIRAIYYYHAITKDWGDIGYNYLIDQYGKIYEGRKGGNRVIGGHVFGYNVGSIGVSLLGDFHPGSVARGNGPSYLTAAAKNSLEDLVAWRGFDNKVNPLGTWIAGGAYPGVKNNVAGHRDSGATSCPGDYLYSALGSIRKDAYDKYIQYVDYRLIHDTNSGKVYLYLDEENILRWIHDPDVFKAYGFSYSKIEDYNDISEFTIGPTLYNLMQGSSGQVYWVENKLKHWIVNAQAFNAWNFDWDKISTLPDNFVNNITTSYSVTNIITSTITPKVYLLDSGKKIWIKDAASFVGWGFDWSKITWVSGTVLDSFTDENFNINKLFKTSADSDIFFSNNQIYHKISRDETLDAWNLDIDQADIIDVDFVDNYLENSVKELSNLIDYSGSVYLVDSGGVRHIPSESMF